MPRKCFVFGSLPRPLFVGAGGIGVGWLTSRWSTGDSADADGFNGDDRLTRGCCSATASEETDWVNGGDGLDDG